VIRRIVLRYQILKCFHSLVALYSTCTRALTFDFFFQVPVPSGSWAVGATPEEDSAFPVVCGCVGVWVCGSVGVWVWVWV
jgi:hypothetical protein